MNGSTQRWHREGERTLLQTAIFQVNAVQYRHPQRGTAGEFVVLNAPDWVVALALTPADELVFVRQFRFGTDAVSLELPGGIIDPGETPEAAAARELVEETGFVGTRVQTLGFAHPNPAIQSNRNHIVFIEGAIRTQELAWDEHEELETLLLPVEDALRAARDGRVTHALMLNALFRFEPVWRSRSRSGPGGV